MKWNSTIIKFILIGACFAIIFWYLLWCHVDICDGLCIIFMVYFFIFHLHMKIVARMNPFYKIQAIFQAVYLLFTYHTERIAKTQMTNLIPTNLGSTELFRIARTVVTQIILFAYFPLSFMRCWHVSSDIIQQSQISQKKSVGIRVILLLHTHVRFYT